MSKPSAFGPLLFTFQTVACQVVAGATTSFTWSVTELLLLSLCAGTLAACGMAILLQLPRSWQGLNTILPFSFALSLTVSLPGWVFFVPLTLMLCIYAPAFWTRVPYYPTNRAAYPLILAELPADRPFTFVDIGCGFGDLIFFLKRHRPNGTFLGIEIGLLPYLGAKIRGLIIGQSGLELRFQDMARLSLSNFDFVYAFLSPAAMTKVWSKASLEMSPRATFITNSFKTPVEATYKIQVKDKRNSTLFVHKIASSPISLGKSN